MVVEKKEKCCELRPTPRFFVWSLSSPTVGNRDSAVTAQGLAPNILRLSEVLLGATGDSEFGEQRLKGSVNNRDEEDSGESNDAAVKKQVRFSKYGGRMVARAIATHSFTILRDDLGSISKTYRACAKELNAFFAEKDDVKEACTAAGGPYFDERGLPMWIPGYERCGEIREAYRIHAGKPDRQPWPSPTFRDAFLDLQHKLRGVCDAALVAVVQCTSAPPLWTEDDGDLSVCYALHYPNVGGIKPPSSINDCDNDMSVGEHRDPSLMVIEPCCGVSGLEVQDHRSKEWIPIESVCNEGTDLVLFCGKAMESATGGWVPATVHRVRQGTQKRVCFIFEQKYRIFFPVACHD